MLSITGAWVALHDALMAWVEAGKIARLPLTGQVAAVSMGLVDGCELLDLDYSEDSHAEVDMNLVATDAGEIIEIQGTGEQTPFDRARLNRLLDLGELGIKQLIDLQNEVTGKTRLLLSAISGFCRCAFGDGCVLHIGEAARLQPAWAAAGVQFAPVPHYTSRGRGGSLAARVGRWGCAVCTRSPLHIERKAPYGT